MSRYTDRDVRNAFDWFVGASNDAGIDTTGWVLHGGNSSYGYSWRIVSPRAQSINSIVLGTTKREAYKSLRVMALVLEMTNR